MAKTLPVMLLKRLILFPNQEIKLELNNSLSLKVLSLSEKKYNKEFVVVSPKDYLEEAVFYYSGCSFEELENKFDVPFSFVYNRCKKLKLIR